MRVNEGDFLMLSGLFKVCDVNGKKLQVQEVNTGKKITLKGSDVLDLATCSGSYETVVKMGKVELATKFVTQSIYPFTCFFTKEDGSDRLLVGIAAADVNILGRISVVDLEIGELRFVDLRDIKWFISDNVKYILEN